MNRRPDLRTPAWRKLRIAVLDRDGWRCTYCGRDIEGKDAQVDHIEPFIDEETSNVMHNLVAACGSCNGTKQDRVRIRMPWHNTRWLTHL